MLLNYGNWKAFREVLHVDEVAKARIFLRKKQKI